MTAEDSKLPFTRTQYFDENVWRTDLRRIERLYRARGYYQARVVKDEVVPDEKGGVNLLGTVEENRPTVVASVELTGLDALPTDVPASTRVPAALEYGDAKAGGADLLWSKEC